MTDAQTPTATPPADSPQPEQRNAFTARFSTGELPVAADRYRLIVADMCPMSHHALIVRNLLGLDQVIGLGKVDSVRGDRGWQFSADPDGVDPELGIRFLSEAYFATSPGYDGAVTVPALIDLETGQVVNNDEVYLGNEFELAWTAYQSPTAPNLYPEPLRKDIDKLNKLLVDELHDGVFRIRGAESQAEYEQSFDRLFARMDDLEEQLGNARYLMGDEITDPDITLFTVLVRFDIVYNTVFAVNRSRLSDFPNLWEYARDLFQQPQFGTTTDFESIKRGNALWNPVQNPHGIIPKGPDVSGWFVPSRRDEILHQHHVER
ncbi:glutathione S-transferase C-terminal domain-containing protein [Nigerium massiliense]|uniref:glutathione S-transferase C-terminal domain-containing protein n=1 Tax=Nigerium massiliense TaxID=1522317 RepID=UPI000694FB82|nr:glutathione S-transferase C-terminal domain-containing protein [Nigerium massiliense]